VNIRGAEHHASPPTCGANARAYWAKTHSDWATVLVLFLAGTAAGMVFVSRDGEAADFYQERMGPAVMLACGRGFVNPAVNACPPLQEFLARKTPRFSPADLPSDIPTHPPTAFQVRHRYLYTAIGLAWRLSGISWAALLPLFGALYGASVACVYGLFRLGTRRFIAVAGAALVLMSPVHLAMLPSLRDYSKAPFLLALILALGHLVKRPWSRRGLAGMVLLCGGIIGIGLGFRQDLLIGIPAVVAVILALIPTGPRTGLAVRVAAVGFFLLVVFVCAFPVLMGDSEPSDVFDFFVQGFMEPFDAMLGADRAPYTLGQLYLDEYGASIVNGHAFFAHGNRDLLTFYTVAYNAYARDLFLTMLRHFPADMALRAWAAVVRVLNELPFANLSHLQNAHLVVPTGTTNDFMLKVYGWRLALLKPFQGWGLVLALGSIVVLCLRRFRYGVAGLFFLLYFIGHTALQFAPRHLFHLEFVALWALGFLAQRLLDAAMLLVRRGGIRCWRERLAAEPDMWRAPIRRLAVFALCPGLCLIVGFIALRTYQQAHVRQLAVAYVDAERLSVPVMAGDAGNGLVAVGLAPGAETALFAGQEDMPARTAYLVAEFACTEAAAFDCIAWYEAKKPSNNTTAPAHLKIPLCPDAGARFRYFFPVYETSDAFWLGERRFQGLVMPADRLRFFQGLYRVADPASLPLRLYWMLPPDWQDLRFYQILTR